MWGFLDQLRNYWLVKKGSAPWSWLVCWLVDRLVGWLVSQSVSRSVSYLVVTHLQFFRLVITGLYAHQCTEFLVTASSIALTSYYLSFVWT